MLDINLLKGYMREFREVNAKIADKPFENELDELEDALHSQQYKIALIGEFSTGKSTFINALLGRKLLYSANIESTGAVTTIRYSDTAYMQIDGGSQKYPLESAEDIERLNEFLDIKSNRCAQRVDIYYPVDGMAREVIFFDTPGIEKLSPEQLKLTANVIREVNATLFLVKSERFTAPALKVLTGKDEEIGKLPAGEIFVVMTHISDFYDNTKYTESESKERIDSSIDDIRNQLEENGLTDMHIYPVDSMEYLWAVNEEEYEHERQTRNVMEKGEMLSTEKYLERSGFGKLRSDLFEFLGGEQRMASFIKDIREKMLFVLSEMEDKAKEEGREVENILSNNEKQQQLSNNVKARRKFINSIIRDLENYIESFRQAVETSINKKYKNEKDSIAELIDKQIVSARDVNSQKLERFLTITKNNTIKSANNICANVNKFYEQVVTKWIKQHFSDAFSQHFGQKVEFEPNISFDEFKMEYEPIEKASIEDANIKKLQESIREQNEQLKLSKQKKQALHGTAMLASAKVRSNEIDKWYEKETNNLGERPKKKQKYRQERRTKGIFFWKQEWVEDIPDGLDDSEQRKWDSDMKALENEYLRRRSEAEQLSNQAYGVQRQEAELDRKIKALNDDIVRKKREIEELNRINVNIEGLHQAQYIGRKKTQMLTCCISLKHKMLDQLYERIVEYLFNFKNTIKANIQVETDRQLEKYKADFEKRTRELEANIRISPEESAKLYLQIHKLREDIENG